MTLLPLGIATATVHGNVCLVGGVANATSALPFQSIGLVVCVWATSWVAWSSNTRRGLAALGVVCDVITWAVGITQSVVPPGPFHWVVEVGNLALGIIMPAGGLRPANAVSHRRVVSTTSR